MNDLPKEGWFDPLAWEPWVPPRSGHVPPPGSDNPFSCHDIPLASPTNAISHWPSPISIAPGRPRAGSFAVLDAEGLDMGRPLDLPPPQPPIAIPGLVGELVEYCWQSAPWQIAEVAIGSALSLMSLLSSRVYRHGTLGLSLYLLLLAKTSTGKSFGFTANDRIFNEVVRHFEAMKPPHYEGAKRRVAVAKKMIITDPGSAQGLVQHMPDSPSTLWHADEYIEYIKLMAQPNPPIHAAALRAEILKLMEMSGPGRVYRGRKYSKRGANSNDEVDIFMASLSILATGVPEAFYDDISATLLTSGFLPRFTIIEYAGNIPMPNPAPQNDPSPAMMGRLLYMFNQSYTRGQSISGSLAEIIDVQPHDDDAESKIRWFENVCIRNAVKANDKSLPTGGLWSRAKEHVKQIASLIAIGVNPHNPKIEEAHVEMAISIVRPSVEKLCAKFDAGEIGITDDRRKADIRKFIAKMYVGGTAKYGKYPGVKSELLDAGIIQLYVVRNYCRLLASFKNHKLDTNKAFNDAVADMIRYGELQQFRTDGHDGSCVKPNLEIFRPLFEEAVKGTI